MANVYKPGYKTSEFWFTLVSFLCSGLYLLGMLNKEQQETSAEVVSHAIESIILVGGQVAIFLKYMKSRSEVKKAVLNQPKPVELEEKVGAKKKPDVTKAPSKKRGKSNGKPRTSKGRTN